MLYALYYYILHTQLRVPVDGIHPPTKVGGLLPDFFVKLFNLFFLFFSEK